MKRISLVMILIMIILLSGCTLLDNKEVINDDYTGIQNSGIKVNIESDKVLFYNEEATFTSVLEGELNNQVQYHWILKDSLSSEGIHGFVSGNGPVNEITNSGEPVKFAIYAEVSYIEDAYSEIVVLLQIEEKGTNNIVATDEVTIINRQGEYFVITSKEKELQDEILKSDKSKLYADIFNIVWEIDKGLNSDTKYINIDTSTFKDFTEEDKEQLFDYIAKKYNSTIMDKTFQELEDEGYIKNLTFIDGINFKVDEYIKNSENEISFEGAKWASGLGAIGFTTKAEKINGTWKIKTCNMTWIS